MRWDSNSSTSSIPLLLPAFHMFQTWCSRNQDTALPRCGLIVDLFVEDSKERTSNSISCGSYCMKDCPELSEGTQVGRIQSQGRVR